MDKNKPTAGRTKAIHRRLELSFNLYLLLLFVGQNRASKSLLHITPDFPHLAVFQQIKHLKDNSSSQNPLVIVGFLGWPYAAVIIGTRVRQRMKGSATRSSYFLTRRMNDWSFCVAEMPLRKKSRPWGWGDSQRTGVRTYPLFVLAEMLMKKLSGIVGKIYE